MPKPKNLFARKKDIVAEKKKLRELKKQRTKIKKNLREVLEMYNLPEDIADRLSNKDAGPQSKIGQDDLVHLVQIRDKLRVEHKELLSDLEAIIADIKVTQINLALAKVKCLEKELDK